MSVSVTVRGALEPITVDETFLSLVNDLNLAKSKNYAFMVADSADGQHVAIQIDNILYFVDNDDEDADMPNIFG